MKIKIFVIGIWLVNFSNYKKIYDIFGFISIL